MGIKEDFYKTKIDDLCNTYKAAASLSILAAAQNNVELVKKLHIDLNDIFLKVIEVLKLYGDKKIIDNVRNGNFEDIPEFMDSLKIIDSYQKILSLKYTKIESDNIEDKIMMNKLSIELNPSEEIAYLNIARILYENKHYAEALELCKFIKTITDTAPVWSLLGDIYRELKWYGDSIDAYITYLKLNEDDEDAANTLCEIYEEALS